MITLPGLAKAMRINPRIREALNIGVALAAMSRKRGVGDTPNLFRAPSNRLTDSLLRQRRAAPLGGNPIRLPGRPRL